jgi:type I restriction-modification system DNA methylase subunit
LAKNQTITDHKQEIIRLIQQAAYTKDTAQVFSDFVEISSISISNTLDFTHREEREQRYMNIIHSYDKKHQELFPEMMGQLVLALDEKVQTAGTEDVLGSVFNELELANKHKAQVFTPQHVADCMALMTLASNDYQGIIEENGYISILEPCCGSGILLTGFCFSL